MLSSDGQDGLIARPPDSLLSNQLLVSRSTRVEEGIGTRPFVFQGG